MLPDDPRHGTTRGYHAGCREACCRAAIARYEKAGRLARLSGGRAVPALGAQRRIQALLCLGWTSTDIAHAAGWGNRNYVLRVLKGQKGKPTTWLEQKTHDTIARVYDDLSMRLPERTPQRARTQSIARRKGFVPPLAWDCIDDPGETPRGIAADADLEPTDIDPVVVERFLTNDLTPGLWATVAEKREIVRRWLEQGGTQAELARRTGWNITRYTQREDVA